MTQGQYGLLKSISLPWFVDYMILRQILQKGFTDIDLIDIFATKAAPVASVNSLCLFPLCVCVFVEGTSICPFKQM